MDLLPTLAELAQAPPVGVGRSLVPVLLNPEASVQDCVLFAFDDNFVLPADQPGGRLRALRYGDDTYAVYYGSQGGPFEFELYDNQADPQQLDNLLSAPDPATVALWRDLHARLLAKLEQTNAFPPGFDFPAQVG